MKRKKRAEKLALFQQHGLGLRPAVLVADSLGMTEGQFTRQCQYYEISTAYKNIPFSPSEVAEIIGLREEGLSWPQIGKQVNRPAQSCGVLYRKLKNEKAD